MLTEEDLDHYMIWNGYTAQSREATRPELVRGVRWLAKVGLTRSPLQAPLSPSPDARLRRIVDPARFKASEVDEGTGGRLPERSPTLACDPGLRRKKGAKPRFGRVRE